MVDTNFKTRVHNYHLTTHYVSESNICRKVKADYMKPVGLLQSLSILE
jgi:hypothetical protein